MSGTLKFAHVWHRRISGGVVFVSLVILGLFAWHYFTDRGGFISQTAPIDDTSAILAGTAFVAAAISYLWVPKRYPAGLSLLSYTFLWLAIGMIVVGTGGGNSPFIVLWVMAAVFAGLFGAFGLLPMLLAPAVYLGWRFLEGSFVPSEVVTVVLAGELPAVLSYLAWTLRPSGANGPNSTYQELASELSQVAGKSDVVINAITDGVLALNSQGNIQLINPAAQEMIGWGKQDAVMLNYKSVLKLTDAKGGELAPATDPVVRVLATNEEIRTNDLMLITSSGKKLLVSLVVTPVGQPGSGVIVVFRDITKEKTEEKQQAEFISTASHEMRTPVASIEGYLGLALNPATAQIDVKARDYITKAHESAQHLGRLFSDLLDVSKAEDGRLSNNPSVVDVVAFTHDIVQGLRPKAEAKGLALIFKPLPDGNEAEVTTRRLNPVFYVNVDNDHLREVIANLVENGIKYTLRGTVTVDVGGDGEHVVVSVEDSGIGIPAEDLPHLFQKFYRVDNSDTREIGGTGLGLYLCRRLTEAMEGRIWVESVYKQGSTFYVELPRISHEEAMRLIEVVGQKEEASQQPTAVPMPEAVAAPVAPQPAPPALADETAYVNPPADAVAAQLAQAAQSQTAGVTEAPQMPPTAPMQQGNGAAGPSLAAIEQNPNQYLRRPGSVAIPTRDQNQP